MDGKTLARIGAIVFVVLAIVAAVIDVNRPDNPQVGLAMPRRPVIERDPLDAELARCSGLGEAGPRDPSCLKVWAENRRRFLGQPAASTQSPTPGDTPASALAPTVNGDR
ncbi:putative entry exclusion protein TrbK-alt [Acidocella aromatica]|uniref:Conjugative transfer region protein TrbK n=1 Tax=Acidocella aromatica TaxID=1303579 RepID=A0A840VGJ4_9PROT|nr:putative entry exclusion protein TrbK-alt [Acidocella aromatica]MBB5374017.1 conjugative transfer region protein TrbK [Acidocella aromatica]